MKNSQSVCLKFNDTTKVKYQYHKQQSWIRQAALKWQVLRRPWAPCRRDSAKWGWALSSRVQLKKRPPPLRLRASMTNLATGIISPRKRSTSRPIATIARICSGVSSVKDIFVKVNIHSTPPSSIDLSVIANPLCLIIYLSPHQFAILWSMNAVSKQWYLHVQQ